jgi:hypothetical protein
VQSGGENAEGQEWKRADQLGGGLMLTGECGSSSGDGRNDMFSLQN